jgi:hypothetical protein
MSRVVYTSFQTTAEQEALRAAHCVRLVTAGEEGTGVNALPGGVYGFTYSPGLTSAPLFAERRYRGYEIHKLPDGEAFVVGFTTSAMARELSTAEQDVEIRVQPEADGDADTLVTIPYSRVRHHRQYAAPNQHGFTVMVAPA